MQSVVILNKDELFENKCVKKVLFMIHFFYLFTYPAGSKQPKLRCWSES